MASRSADAAAIACLLTLAATPALAQTPADTSAEIAALRAQITAMSQRLNELEQRTQANAAPVATASPVTPAAATPAPITPAPAAVATAAVSTTPAASERGVPPAPLARALTGLGQEVELLASSDSSRVSFKITREISATRLKGKAAGWGTSTRWTGALSAPVAKGSDTGTNLLTQDGFASDFQATLGLSKLFRRLRNPGLDPDLLDMTRKAYVKCQETKTLEACKAAEQAGAGDAFVELFLGHDEGEKFRSLASSPSAHIIGAELSGGYLKHKYVDLVTVTKEEETEKPWGLKLYYAYMPDRDTSYLISVQHVDAKKDQDQGVRCPVPPASAFSCLPGALGAPKQADKLIWGAEYRHLFNLNFTDDEQPLFRAVGIAPQILHDSRNDVTSLDLPIYFVPNDKGEYIGGVRLAWSSKDHDIVAGLFVNRAFGVRP